MNSTRTRDFLRLVATAVLAFVVTATAAAAQTTDPTKVQMTRADLEELLAELERSANSDAYSSAAKARASAEAAMVRQRLQEGDFQTGDRIVLSVRGEPSLTDTFAVDDSRSLPLPLGTSVPLEGVLRSEIEDHLREHLSQYIRDPDVRAESLLRVSVSGQVVNPGFYTVRAEALVDDVLMTAGGPTQAAALTNLQIDRAGRVIWEGVILEQAVAQGRTLDQLNIRAGDRFVMPEQQPTRAFGDMLMYIVPPIVGIILAVAALD